MCPFRNRRSMSGARAGAPRTELECEEATTEGLMDGQSLVEEESEGHAEVRFGSPKLCRWRIRTVKPSHYQVMR